MLLAYSLGLGIPFILRAVLIDYLKTAFQLDQAKLRHHQYRPRHFAGSDRCSDCDRHTGPFAQHSQLRR